MVLEQRQRVRVTRGQITQVEHRAGERGHLHRRALGEEPFGDPALVEQLDRSGMEPATATACQGLRLTPLENDDSDPRESQLPCQHHPRRPTADDDHVMHLDLAPCVPAP